MPLLDSDPSPVSPSARCWAAIGQIPLQWPSLRDEGFPLSPVLDFRDPAMREILRLMAPATIGLAAVQINVFVNTYLATGQPQGAVSGSATRSD